MRPTAVVLNPNGVTVGQGTLADQVMTAAGLDNIAAKLRIDNYGQIPLEIVALHQVDVLIVSASRDGPPSMATEMLRHPILSQAQADADRRAARPALELRRSGRRRGRRAARCVAADVVRARSRNDDRACQRLPLRERVSYGALVAYLSLLVVVLAAGSLSVGYAPLDMREAVADALQGRSTLGALVLVELRIPRMMLGALVGFSLGIAGAAMQGLLRNPLAEPGITGVSGMAALGAVIVFYFGLAGACALVLPLGGIAGAAVATFMLYGIAGQRRRNHDADPRRRRHQQLCRRADVARAQPRAKSVRGDRDRLLAARLARRPQPAICLARAAADGRRLDDADHRPAPRSTA